MSQTRISFDKPGYEPGTFRTDFVVKTYSRYARGTVRLALGYVSPDGAGRHVQDGPLVPGPWVYTFPHASVIDNHGGTVAESLRKVAAGTEVEAQVGDEFVIDGRVYVLTDDRPMHYPDLTLTAKHPEAALTGSLPVGSTVTLTMPHVVFGQTWHTGTVGTVVDPAGITDPRDPVSVVALPWAGGTMRQVIPNAYLEVQPEPVRQTGPAIGYRFPNGCEVVAVIRSVARRDEAVVVAYRAEYPEYVTGKVRADDPEPSEWFWGNYFAVGGGDQADVYAVALADARERAGVAS